MSRLVEKVIAFSRSIGERSVPGIAGAFDRILPLRRVGGEVSGTVADAENHRISTTHPAEGSLVREGTLVRLRAHSVANRPAFQRWYADDEIARLLRHDQRPLNAIQSRSYFDTIIMPLSARGMCFAIHEAATDRLVGTTALTDIEGAEVRSALFRIVIGEKDCWGRGYGTEATRLVVEEAFGRLNLDRIRLEVFGHNARALAAYRRVGFRATGQHVEYVGRERFELHVIEMALDRVDYALFSKVSFAGEILEDGEENPVGATFQRFEE